MFESIVMALTVLVVFGGVRREVVRCLNSLDLEADVNE